MVNPRTPPVELVLLCQPAGDVWHVEVTSCPRADLLYGVRVYGDGGWDVGHRWDSKRVLLDPYAPLVSGRRLFGVRDSIEQYTPEVMLPSDS